MYVRPCRLAHTAARCCWPQQNPFSPPGVSSFDFIVHGSGCERCTDQPGGFRSTIPDTIRNSKQQNAVRETARDKRHASNSASPGPLARPGSVISSEV